MWGGERVSCVQSWDVSEPRTGVYPFPGVSGEHGEVRKRGRQDASGAVLQVSAGCQELSKHPSTPALTACSGQPFCRGDLEPTALETTHGQRRVCSSHTGTKPTFFCVGVLDCRCWFPGGWSQTASPDSVSALSMETSVTVQRAGCATWAAVQCRTTASGVCPARSRPQMGQVRRPRCIRQLEGVAHARSRTRAVLDALEPCPVSRRHAARLDRSWQGQPYPLGTLHDSRPCGTRIAAAGKGRSVRQPGPAVCAKTRLSILCEEQP